MKVAIYLRVSTEEQAKEGYSIDAQRQRLTDFARSQSWDIYEYYIDDGYSAKSLDRPNVQRMISDIKARKFDVVLVYRLDRLVRSVMNLHELLTLFDDHNVKFRSATEMFDTTSAMGRFFITLVGAMAQWERENLAERVRMGMTQKHAEGGRNGAVAPYGYRIVNGELVIEPIEADIVRRIFRLYRENMGALAIAKLFNREGIPKDDSNGWNYNTVYYIITNPVYTGKIRWNYRKARGNRTGEEVIVDGTHEALISEKEFLEIQRLRESRAKEGKSESSEFMFTGVLRCGRCGYGMIGGSRPVKGGRRKFYRCVGRVTYGTCDMPFISESTVMTEFLDSFEYDSEKLSRLIVIKVPAQEHSTHIVDEIERELEAIKKRKKKWYVSWGNDLISDDDLRELTREDDAREKVLNERLSEIMAQKEKSPRTVEDYVYALRSFKDGFLKLKSDARRKQIISKMYEQITINTNASDIKGGPGRFVPIEITGLEFKEPRR